MMKNAGGLVKQCQDLCAVYYGILADSLVYSGAAETQGGAFSLILFPLMGTVLIFLFPSRTSLFTFTLQHSFPGFVLFFREVLDGVLDGGFGV